MARNELSLTGKLWVDTLFKGASRLICRSHLPSSQQRPRRLARPRTPPFHGDNAGSNPAGDAKSSAAAEVRVSPGALARGRGLGGEFEGIFLVELGMERIRQIELDHLGF